MRIRRLLLNLMASLAFGIAATAVPVIPGAVQPANAQVSIEFQGALAPYGAWRRHPQFGEVWVPRGVPRDWRPYEYGHWVYTDDWGWYWVSDDQEEDWGWVAYHYGRWAFDRGFGWFWVPGDEWAPAWVDWRYGDDYVGWAPLPPDELIGAYEEDPTYWVFVAPRYLIAPRPRGYFLPLNRRAAALHGTRVVNRTLAVHGARLAVNPGIPAGFVASVTRKPLPSYRVRPHVLAGTQGVAGAIVAQPGGRGRVNAISVQRTNATIAPSASVAAPAALGKDERGRLGPHPPRAAQGAGAGAPGAGPAITPKTPAVVPQAAPATTPVAPATTPLRPQLRPGQPPPTGGPPPQTGAPTQVKPLRSPPPQTPPPAVVHPASPPPVVRPAAPPPVVHPAPPPVAHPAPPPVAHPAPPPVARPPPPAAMRPPPPKPPVVAPAKPAVKPGEKPVETPK
jgi:hypothetical protein